MAGEPLIHSRRIFERLSKAMTYPACDVNRDCVSNETPAKRSSPDALCWVGPPWCETLESLRITDSWLYDATARK
jgi:hypothetical protein